MKIKYDCPKNAFICYTKYQLFNVLNLIFHNKHNFYYASDLYIEENLSNLNEIVSEISNKNIFCNIYFFSQLKIKLKILRKLYIVLCLIIPSWGIYKAVVGQTYKRKRYQSVYASTFGVFVVNMISCCKGKVYLFEDGTDSYNGNIQNRLSCISKIILRIKIQGGLKIKALYLNDINFCSFDEESKVVQLPKIQNDNSFMDFCREIFSYEDSQYANFKFIYLHMPMEIIKHNGNVNEKDFLPCEICNKNTLIRMHPSTKISDENLKINVDLVENIWELECFYSINESHVLISCFSTSLFLPKLLFEKEPILIFTYKIWKIDFMGYDLKKMDQTIQKLKFIYTKKERIFVPETISEYYDIIKKIRILE